MNAAPKGYRWAKMGEALPANAMWFDEDPDGTTVPLEPVWLLSGIFKMDRAMLEEIHRKRHKDWPSDAHGLCGVVIPS